MLSSELDRFDGILRDDAAIVFHFHLELIVRQDSFSQVQDLPEPIGAQPMIDVLTDVGLEQNRFGLSGHAAAIDEVFHHVPDLCDVGVPRDEVAIRQDKPGEGAWMLFERRAEIR